MAQYIVKWRLFDRKDPVSGVSKSYVRQKGGNRITSETLKKFHSCVREALQGKEYRSGTHKENTISVRTAFVAASHSCKKG